MIEDATLLENLKNSLIKELSPESSRTT